MYGVTEMESVDFLNPVALYQGMLDKERNDELRQYLKLRCDNKVENCLERTLKMYIKDSDRLSKVGSAEVLQNRDVFLDVLSDARSVAPVIQTGRFHSKRNIQSYFYVFTHKTHSKEYKVSTYLDMFGKFNCGIV